MGVVISDSADLVQRNRSALYIFRRTIVALWAILRSSYFCRLAELARRTDYAVVFMAREVKGRVVLSRAGVDDPSTAVVACGTFQLFIRADIGVVAK